MYKIFLQEEKNDMAWVLKIEVNVKDWVFKVVKQQYIDIYLVFEWSTLCIYIMVHWEKNRYYKKCEYQIWVTNMSFYEYAWANIFFCVRDWNLSILKLLHQLITKVLIAFDFTQCDFSLEDCVLLHFRALTMNYT